MTSVQGKLQTDKFTLFKMSKFAIILFFWRDFACNLWLPGFCFYWRVVRRPQYIVEGMIQIGRGHVENISDQPVPILSILVKFEADQ